MAISAISLRQLTRFRRLRSLRRLSVSTRDRRLDLSAWNGAVCIEREASLGEIKLRRGLDDWLTKSRKLREQSFWRSDKKAWRILKPIMGHDLSESYIWVVGKDMDEMLGWKVAGGGVWTTDQELAQSRESLYLPTFPSLCFHFD
jgi:hypothetical protein